MKRVYKDHAERQDAYRARQKEKQEAAAEAAEEIAKMKSLDLRFFGESAYGQNAESSRDEIQSHRSFLRALGQPEIQPGETLRDLAGRTWNALLNAEGIGVYQSGDDAWIPMYSPNLQQFDGWHGYTVSGALRSGYFDEHWQPPKDCTGDEAIDIETLPALPPMKRVNNFESRDSSKG